MFDPTSTASPAMRAACTLNDAAPAANTASPCLSVFTTRYSADESSHDLVSRIYYHLRGNIDAVLLEPRPVGLRRQNPAMRRAAARETQLPDAANLHGTAVRLPEI